MATNGNEFDEVGQEAQTTNGNNEFEQTAQATDEDTEVAREAETTNRNNVPEVAEDACQGDTTKCGDIVQVGHENESGGLISWAAGSVRQSVSGWRQSVSGKVQQWFGRPVSQCSYIDGDPNITSYKIIYRSLIERSTKAPYTFKFHDPAHTITGIACLPKDAETSSPEAEVVRGGVGCKEVEIRLTPVDKGNWCCRVQINGIEDNRLQMDSTSYKTLTM